MHCDDGEVFDVPSCVDEGGRESLGADVLQSILCFEEIYRIDIYYFARMFVV